MPVVYIKDLDSDVKLGLWKIEETVSQFMCDSSDIGELYDVEISRYKSDSRKL